MNHSHNLSLRELKSLLKNENYKKYNEEKEKIKQKYDSKIFEDKNFGKNIINKWYKEEGRKEYIKYIKEICDLMYEPDGHFQKFIWESLSESDKELMERKARTKRTRKIEY